MSNLSRDTWDNVVIVTRDGTGDALWDGRVKSLVYNLVTMAWEAEVQPATTGGVGGGGDASAANQTIEIAKLTSIDGKLGSLGQKAMAGSAPVTIASDQGAVPVSGPLTDTLLRASAVPITVDGVKITAAVMPAGGSGAIGWLSAIWDRVSASATSLAGTLAVSIQNATLAVTQSGAWVLSAGAALIGKVGIDQTTNGTTNRVNISSDGSVTLLAGTNRIGSVRPVDSADADLTSSKATQTSRAIGVQNLKDAGRSARIIFLDSFAVAATGETLMTMSYSTDNGAATTGTSYSVTAGKRLRIQAILASLHTITGNTTAVTVIVRIRVNNGGAALVSSPIQMVIPIQGIAAANQAGIPVVVPIPDGWEFVAGAGIGITVACAGFVATTAAPKVDISIIAEEY